MSLAEEISPSPARHVPQWSRDLWCTERVSQVRENPEECWDLAWHTLMRTCAGPEIAMTTPSATKEAAGSARGQECRDKNRQTGCGFSHLGGHCSEVWALHHLNGEIWSAVIQQLDTSLWPSAQLKGAHPTWPWRQNGGHSFGSKVCAPAGESVLSSSGQCPHSDVAAAGKGCSADLRLQEGHRPFSWQQTCRQNIYPRERPPATSVWPAGTGKNAV